MNVYFFKHSGDRYENIPGRYPFRVRAAALERGGAVFVRQAPRERVIHADGYGPDETASNVDPNVFSKLLPWFLTYCLQTGREKHRVHDLTTGRLLPRALSHLVEPGDVILFGWPTSKTGIAIDTVMCVERAVLVPVEAGPQRKKRFAFNSSFSTYRDEVKKHFRDFGTVSWQSFTAADDFRLNVVDTLSEADAHAVLGYTCETHHKTTDLLDHKQIIGRWGDVPDEILPGALLDAFVDGRGFNFIPRAAPTEGAARGVAHSHPGLLTIRTPAPHGLPGGGVARLSSTGGVAVLQQVFDVAEELVFGRIEWLARRRFERAPGRFAARKLR